jgi:hypothetical protein
VFGFGPESDMHTRVVRSLSEIEPECWDQVSQGDTKLKSWAFLRAVEEGWINQARCSYIQVFSGSDCVGTSVCSVVRTSLVVLAQGFVQKLTKLIRTVAPGFLTANVAVGGTLISSCTNSLSYLENDALPLLIYETEKAARAEGAGFVLFKDFTPDEVRRHGPVFASLGYDRVASLPGTVVEVGGASSMDEFLMRFRSEYRWTIRKDKMKAQQAGLEVRDERIYGDRADDFIRLYHQVLDRAPSRFGILTPAFVVAMARHMGDASLMKIFTVHDEVVAIALLVEDGDVLRTLYLGMDYTHRPDRLYFAWLYHTVLHGIEHGYSRIDLGQKSYEAKARYGAQRWPVAMYVKHLHPTLNKVLAHVASQLFPPIDVNERRVFRAPSQKGDGRHCPHST